MKRLLAIFLGGALFGLGLAIAGMTKQEVVLSFLQFKDFGLLFVMGIGVLFAFLAYTLLPRLMKKPVLGGHFQRHEHKLDKSKLLGAAIFGAGWGISGLCPGSALTSLGVGNYPVIIGLVGIFIGAYVQGRFS